jgi:hypothetical protein
MANQGQSGGDWCRRPEQRSHRGDKLNILNEKNDFLRPKKF